MFNIMEEDKESKGENGIEEEEEEETESLSIGNIEVNVK